ncbi:uncharacterized protein LOC127856151 [Dreissena polymorpha]|uniref:uncharacterized protein LOC127856151 n=1 Tax=Dreissena polymorpha TaxID=45954 RepID=UPI00226457A5|nr:uncharacterized protein LOC127856151 [Dreissena polymorpha]XP_052248148.1 uncharacterized protein LOC127856151 [Dreissena polymorpha]
MAVAVDRPSMAGGLKFMPLISVAIDEHKKVARIVKISYAASVIAFAVAVTHIYAASSEFGIYNDVTYVDAWDWWILQTLLRLEELSSAFIIVLIAFRNPLEGTKFYSWCAKWTSTTSDSNTNSSERNVANSLVTYTMVEKF